MCWWEAAQTLQLIWHCRGFRSRGRLSEIREKAMKLTSSLWFSSPANYIVRLRQSLFARTLSPLWIHLIKECYLLKLSGPFSNASSHRIFYDPGFFFFFQDFTRANINGNYVLVLSLCVRPIHSFTVDCWRNRWPSCVWGFVFGYNVNGHLLTSAQIELL